MDIKVLVKDKLGLSAEVNEINFFKNDDTPYNREIYDLNGKIFSYNEFTNILSHLEDLAWKENFVFSYRTIKE